MLLYVTFGDTVLFCIPMDFTFAYDSCQSNVESTRLGALALREHFFVFENNIVDYKRRNEMKKKLLLCLVAISLLFTMVFSLASCDSYTTEETNSMIAEIKDAISKNKAELDAKINAITTEYKAKDDALTAEIAAGKRDLDALKISLQTRYLRLKLPMLRTKRQ